MKISILDKAGKETGKEVELSDAVFGIEPNDHAIYLDVKRYLAAQRQGTHKSKEKSEITGSTRKLKKQKGTGTARAGSIKSPVFRGGGRVFGPRPRNYDIKLNQKVKALARKSALSYKLKSNDVVALEAVNFSAPKTKEFKSLLEGLSFADSKTLFVLSEDNNNFYLSARNLQKVKVSTVSLLNTYDILNANKVIFLEGSVEKLEELLVK
ncbi:MAG: 50S ribosomal protein L4 [Cytophagales bacterium]|nr:50S ribosomal protein L4 [Cytophagales bacterium]